MIRQIILRKGKFPTKLLRKGAFVNKYFDKDFNFLSEEIDPVTNKTY